MVNDFFSICQCDHRYVLSENFSGIAYIVVVNYVFRALTSLKCQRIGSRHQQSLEKPVSGQILRILVSLRCILKHFPTLCYMAPTGVLENVGSLCIHMKIKNYIPVYVQALKRHSVATVIERRKKPHLKNLVLVSILYRSIDKFFL